MGLFNKKKTKEEERVNELCGGFIGNKSFENKLINHNLDKNTSNGNYKAILNSEIKNEKLAYEDIEERLDELLELDIIALRNKILISKKLDTSSFHTQEDIDDEMGKSYVEKQEKTKLNELEKQVKEKQKQLDKERKNEQKRIEKQEKVLLKKQKQEQKRLEKQRKELMKQEEREAKRIKKENELKEKKEKRTKQILLNGATVQIPRTVYEDAISNAAMGGFFLGRIGAELGAMSGGEKTVYDNFILTFEEKGISLSKSFIMYENIVHYKEENGIIINDKFGNSIYFLPTSVLDSEIIYELLQEKFNEIKS